jgi:uncharacterized protein with PIN domain
MLAHIGRRLREAGYDTRIDGGSLTDTELVRLARAEKRWLLSCDGRIAEIKESRAILAVLPSGREEDWARRLRKLGVDWLHAPFTRCLECNRELEVAPAEARALVPEPVRREGLPLCACPQCHRLFWEGSHVRRMRERLGALDRQSRNQAG